MALEFAKTQLMYAIYKCMKAYDVEEVDFHYTSNKPKFVHDDITYEICWVDIPDIDGDNIEIHINAIPSYAWMMDSLQMKPSDFHRLKTLENIFKAVYDKLADNYDGDDGLYPKCRWEEWCDLWAQEYSDIYYEVESLA